VQQSTTSLEISIPQAQGLVEEGDVCLLDVREDWEWRRGHVAGALHVPLGQLPVRIAELPHDRQVLVICEHGNRSLAAAGYLRARGLPDAVSIAGGTVAWIRAGLPVSRD
jgi:rhodanese-related sulfurtransferase